VSPHLLGAVTLPDAATFAVAAVVCVAGALGTVLLRNPVHCALTLVATLFGIAVLFVEQDAQFLAAVQVIVYAGAIVVLFLFVIMLLGVDRREKVLAEPLRGQRAGAVVLGAATLAAILLLAGARWPHGAPRLTGPLEGHGSNVAVLGRAIFTTYLLPFEVTSALLVVAVVGAVVLARRPRALPGGATTPPSELEKAGEAGGGAPRGAPSGSPAEGTGEGAAPEPVPVGGGDAKGGGR
jgi:NADH-quinone oxidoreductase subunit J